MIPFPPFHVKDDVIRDRFGGHVCHVDPWGIVFSDEMRAHLAQQVCDAINKANPVEDTDAQAAK